MIVYWGMGQYWGNANLQNAKAHLIGHIKVSPSTDSKIQGLLQCLQRAGFTAAVLHQVPKTAAALVGKP